MAGGELVELTRLLSSAAEVISRRAVRRKIRRAAASEHAGTAFEGQVAEALGDAVQDFDRQILGMLDNGEYGRVGQLDIITQRVIVEVTNGTGRNKVSQVLRQQAQVGASHEVVLFAPRMPAARLRDAQNRGVTVFRDLESLIEYVNQ